MNFRFKKRAMKLKSNTIFDAIKKVPVPFLRTEKMKNLKKLIPR